MLHLQWRGTLIFVHAVSLMAAAKADEEPSMDIPDEAPAAFNPREAVAKVAAYQAANPAFAAGIATWVTTGIVLLVVGTALFLYSEIQAMLGQSLCRVSCVCVCACTCLHILSRTFSFALSLSPPSFSL